MDSPERQARPNTNPEAPLAQKYLNLREFSAYTGLSESTIRRLIKKELIKPIQPGGKGHRIVFDRDSLVFVEGFCDQQNQNHPRVTPIELPNQPPNPIRHGPRPRWNQK